MKIMTKMSVEWNTNIYNIDAWQVRHKLNGLSAKKVTTLPIVEGPVIESKSKLMEIIDTTLLKCYLLTNSNLVPSLLRLKENQCHLVILLVKNGNSTGLDYLLLY